jgi:hypothetical protein
MAASVRGLLAGGGRGEVLSSVKDFDYKMALEKFGALSYVASDADLSQLALANIRPAVAALASHSNSSTNVTLLLLLKWGQGSKNRHFVDLHCHATSLFSTHGADMAESASPRTIDAYAVPLQTLSAARSSSGTGGDGVRTGIRLTWLDAGVDLS